MKIVYKKCRRNNGKCTFIQNCAEGVNFKTSIEPSLDLPNEFRLYEQQN